MIEDPDALAYVVGTLAWMGVGHSWSSEQVAEQLRFEQDRIERDLDAAVKRGLVVSGEQGYRITDLGCELVANGD